MLYMFTPENITRSPMGHMTSSHATQKARAPALRCGHVCSARGHTGPKPPVRHRPFFP